MNECRFFSCHRATTIIIITVLWMCGLFKGTRWAGRHRHREHQPEPEQKPTQRPQRHCTHSIILVCMSSMTTTHNPDRTVPWSLSAAQYCQYLPIKGLWGHTSYMTGNNNNAAYTTGNNLTKDMQAPALQSFTPLVASLCTTTTAAAFTTTLPPAACPLMSA